MDDTRMRKTGIILGIVAITAFGLAGHAHAGLIEITPETPNPNDSGTANTNAFGSDAIVSVGYSAYTYSYQSDFGGLNSGTGAAVAVDDSLTGNTLVMTFTAAAGSTVTIKSFNLAQYTDNTDEVDISILGGDISYSLTGEVPAGGAGNTRPTRRM